LKLYVASSWRNPQQAAIVADLRLLGHLVYDFRHPHPGNDGFSWRSIDHDWQRWTPAEWRAALSHPIAKAGFAFDKFALEEAEACVLVLPCGRSAHLEAGYMAGQGKQVLTLALDPCEPELMALLGGPPVNICCTLDELFERVERLKETKQL
jgi:hypothetical protein